MKPSLLLLLPSVLAAQSFSYGVKGGASLTDPAERADESKRYLVGPSIEVALPWRLGVEFNALYSRFGTSFRSGNASGRIRGNSWEFPVLAKHYFAERGGQMRPFASVGLGFRNIWLERGGFEDRRTRVETLNSGLSIGAVAGGGVALKAGRLTISPEFRYTRWGGENFPATNPNQAQVLLGIHF